MRYWTDGTRLFEVVAEHHQRNYGLRPGTITTTLLRDVLTEEELLVDPVHPMALRPVWPERRRS